MSYTTIKKTVNENLDIPLNKQVSLSHSTPEARQAIVNLGYTLKETITHYEGTIYIYVRNNSIGSMAWGAANRACHSWKNKVNQWAVENGYGNICILSVLPYRIYLTENDNAWSRTPTNRTQPVDPYTTTRYYKLYTGTQAEEFHFNSHGVKPEIWII